MSTNRGAVSRDKYNDIRKQLIEMTRAKEDILAKWKEDSNEKSERLASIMREAEMLAEKVRSTRHYHGRNKVTSKEFNRYEHANSKVIAKYVRENIFPHLKFLHKSWSKFLPKDTMSFYYKIESEVGLDVPEDVDPESFWVDSTVPLFNKKICETRSNANTGHKNQYKGKVVRNKCVLLEYWCVLS